jgi:hypothetical protein
MHAYIHMYEKHAENEGLSHMVQNPSKYEKNTNCVR